MNFLGYLYMYNLSVYSYEASCTEKWPAQVVAFATLRVIGRGEGNSHSKTVEKLEKTRLPRMKKPSPGRIYKMYGRILKKLCRSRSAESAPRCTTETLETNINDAMITFFFV